LRWLVNEDFHAPSVSQSFSLSLFDPARRRILLLETDPFDLARSTAFSLSGGRRTTWFLARIDPSDYPWQPMIFVP